MSTPTTPITPYATSPTLSFTSQELDFSLPEGVVFSPLQETSEAWPPPPQTQVVPDTWLSHYAKQPYGYPAHGLSFFNTGYHKESRIPDTPPNLSRTRTIANTDPRLLSAWTITNSQLNLKFTTILTRRYSSTTITWISCTGMGTTS